MGVKSFTLSSAFCTGLVPLMNCVVGLSLLIKPFFKGLFTNRHAFEHGCCSVGISLLVFAKWLFVLNGLLIRFVCKRKRAKFLRVRHVNEAQNLPGTLGQFMLDHPTAPAVSQTTFPAALPAVHLILPKLYR